MKTIVTNMVKGKKRKKIYAKLNRDRWRFIYFKDELQGTEAVGKGNKGISRKI